MGKAIITLTDADDDNNVTVSVHFEDGLNENSAAHRLAAAMLQAAQDEHVPADDEGAPDNGARAESEVPA